MGGVENLRLSTDLAGAGRIVHACAQVEASRAVKVSALAIHLNPRRCVEPFEPSKRPTTEGLQRKAYNGRFHAFSPWSQASPVRTNRRP